MSLKATLFFLLNNECRNPKNPVSIPSFQVYKKRESQFAEQARIKLTIITIS